MRRLNVVGTGVFVLVVMAGCNNAKSPDAVANDVAAAQDKAAAQLADSQQSAAKATDSAAAVVDDKTKDLNAVDAKGAYDVATAKAEGDQKIAIAKCMQLAGDAQKACKDQADARYDLAKANAKAMLAAQKP